MKETLLIGDFLFVNKWPTAVPTRPASIVIPFRINVDAEDFCGVFKGNNDRLFAQSPSAAMSLCSATPV
jgi:signal peptidase I